MGKTILSTLLLVSVIVLSFETNIHLGSAQIVGLVCIAPNGASGCPAPPVGINGNLGGTLSVSVLVQGSEAFSGFDITLIANHTIIRPTGISISNSLLSGGTVVLECIGSSLRAGPHCSPTDTADTLHLSVVGPPGFLTQFPTSGLLFTAVYNVTGTATTTLAFQTGCSNSSISGTAICVQFANGSLSPPLETVQTATYSQTPPPTFEIGSGQNEIILAKSQSGNTTVFITSLNGFAGRVSFTTSISPTVNHPPGVSFSPSSLIIQPGNFNSTLLTVSATHNTTRDTYNMIVVATGGSVTGTVTILVSVTP